MLNNQHKNFVQNQLQRTGIIDCGESNKDSQCLLFWSFFNSTYMLFIDF